VARNANLFQRPPHRQGGLLDQPDDLKLLGGRVPHVASSPSAVTLFFEQTIFEGQFGHDFLQRAGLATQVLDLVRGGGQEVLRPAIVQVLRDPLAATQLGNAVLAAQAFQKPCDKGC
jgi:hypothetical protein